MENVIKNRLLILVWKKKKNKRIGEMKKMKNEVKNEVAEKVAETAVDVKALAESVRKGLKTGEIPKDLKIMVKLERNVSERTGKEYKNVFVRADMQGRDYNIAFAPRQNEFNGYQNIELVYSGGDDVELKMEWDETKDLNTGKVVRAAWKYELVSYDELGVEYACPVKPAGPSDTSMLNSFLQRVIIQAKLAELQKAAEDAAKAGKAANN